MKPTWKAIYPCIRTAVLNLDSTEALLQQTVEAIATTYQADCGLWGGLQSPELLRVYATSGIQQSLASLVKPHQTASTEPALVQPLPIGQMPDWLSEQLRSPDLKQLETGDLIVPVSRRSDSPAPNPPASEPLQFILQLRRPVLAAPAEGQPAATIRGWSAEELESIDILCSQLEMAYGALYWRERLEQSRQQAALVGRIARLLNSSLNPDEIVGRIVAELGQGLACDRCILVDLRDDPVNILATWDHPDRSLGRLEHRQTARHFWQNVLEMFLQGGASFLRIETLDLEPDPLQDWLQEIGAASVLLIPLFTQAEFFGAVALLSYQSTRLYLLDELQTIRQVADQAAIALTNAQHYQSLWYKQEALRLQNNSLQLEVIRDELTQLMNRRSLERELEQLSAPTVWTVQSSFSVIVCDIDYFKLVNDSYGHLVGDEVLQAVAARLQKQLRRETPAYRYGGEEFVVILSETTLSKAVDVAERLRQAVRSAAVKTSAGLMSITASFGVAQQDLTQDRDAWNVLQRADQALYEAKRLGRDRVEALKQAC